MNFDFIKGKINKINLKIVNSFNKLPPDKNDKSKLNGFTIEISNHKYKGFALKEFEL